MDWFSELEMMCSSKIKEGIEYGYSQGDIMLELAIEPSQSVCSMSLKLRERPVLRDGGVEIDVLNYSEIIVPETQLISQMPILQYDGNIRGIHTISFNGQFLVERPYLARAMNGLFETIRAYQGLTVRYPSDNRGGVVERKAEVSITKMGELRKFEQSRLKAMPDTYHTLRGPSPGR